MEPVHEMEKVLFAADELTGLIGAAALMRPSKSTKDMEVKSLKKKYKSKGLPLDALEKSLSVVRTSSAGNLISSWNSKETFYEIDSYQRYHERRTRRDH